MDSPADPTDGATPLQSSRRIANILSVLCTSNRQLRLIVYLVAIISFSLSGELLSFRCGSDQIFVVNAARYDAVFEDFPLERTGTPREYTHLAQVVPTQPTSSTINYHGGTFSWLKHVGGILLLLFTIVIASKILVPAERKSLSQSSILYGLRLLAYGWSAFAVFAGLDIQCVWIDNPTDDVRIASVNDTKFVMRPRTFTTTWVLPLKAARFDVRDLDARMIESTSIFIGPHYFDKVIVYNIEKKNSYYLSHAKYVRK